MSNINWDEAPEAANVRLKHVLTGDIKYGFKNSCGNCYVFYAENKSRLANKNMWGVIEHRSKNHATKNKDKTESAYQELDTDDAVNAPSHYSLFENVEAIQLLASSMTEVEFRGYCFGNLLKYRARVGGKDDVNQEVGKANKYKELFAKYKNLCRTTSLFGQ